ncbi:hypothetical protein B0I72DRAFT_40195 [Yarrowia lipolytica]|jgi:hypothetical protein|uniref:YALI0D07260p n=2 Tax=Yarrowia lipolytica TaxID=4952 RepID=Q6C9Y9_YARLI|nr:YALI0D07260p [Yarrowia lipolytica CLIB122]AOW03714.1 hypothetical protein YALI1_D09238g [Yarrowia lipolytica]KAB8284372.1 hypothetical protein BKA91DRAFT_6089 [Yarrowia lipolytica]KAE8172652.1 hypothetical protein BKA90DRAFT_16728 [Yarrowia lipolytica]KAJ8054686.1 hypothetical protein LXG23DRAFT_56241 [Yarrowia lipolytica]QNP98532.1 Hypothetical protein YALI2_D00973g [Yarrowia lipolytica]|eukprot:XP_502523.1 YALI0D07260p [Yarrowia lipolytica CLIB122]
MGSLLEQLPPEVYASVLDNLSPRDVLRLRKSSRAILDMSEDYATAATRVVRCSIEPTHAACCTLAKLDKYREWDILDARKAPINSEDLLHAEKASVAYLALIIPGLLMPFVVRRESRRQLDRTDLQTLRIAYIQYRDVWKATGQRYIEYQEGGLSILKGSTVRQDETFKTVKIPPHPVPRMLEMNPHIPDYYHAQTVALRFNSELNSLGDLILLHSKTEHNTDENMLSHLFWQEHNSGKMFSMLTIVHVPELGSIIREAYFWNNKVFLFCENYFMEAEIVGAKGARLVVDKLAGTYHTDIAASQDHAVSPADTQVRYISEGKVLLGDYRVLDLDRQTVSHREPWVPRDKQGFYVDLPVRYGNERFAAG